MVARVLFLSSLVLKAAYLKANAYDQVPREKKKCEVQKENKINKS